MLLITLQGKVILKLRMDPRRWWTSLAVGNVIEDGHLETLKWIRENGREWTLNSADWAAGNGHLETLKWIRGEYC
jgi:hypothetical protein